MDILKERDGMVVYTDYERVIKKASNPSNIAGIQNAVRFYLALQDVPWIPKLYDYTDTTLEREYIKEDYTLDNTFHEEFRRNCIRIIFELQRRGIRHGDLVGHNFIVRGTYPIIFDWDQSNFVWEKIPQKTPKPDSSPLYSTIEPYTKDTYRIVRRWQAIRKEIGLYKGWGRLVDLGTHQGDLAALAQSEYYSATGVDALKMRSTCLAEAREWWSPYGCNFVESDIVDFDCSPYNIAVLLSTWAYIIKDKGKDVALATLKRIIEQVDVLFFETQLYKDGPGPDFLKTNDNVYTMLSAMASEVKLLETISGTHTRTLWKVVK